MENKLFPIINDKIFHFYWIAKAIARIMMSLTIRRMTSVVTIVKILPISYKKDHKDNDDIDSNNKNGNNGNNDRNGCG